MRAHCSTGRPVQTVVTPHVYDDVFRDILLRGERIARRQLEQDKSERENPHEDHEALRQTAKDEAQHRVQGSNRTYL